MYSEEQIIQVTEKCTKIAADALKKSPRESYHGWNEGVGLITAVLLTKALENPELMKNLSSSPQ